MPILQRYAVGLHNVGSYQSSGWPYMTGAIGVTAGTILKVEFPMVTKSIMITPSGSFEDGGASTIRVNFGPDDANVITGDEVYLGHHYLTMDNVQDVITMNVKCKEMYIQFAGPGDERGYQLMAELTNIPTAAMFELTGTGVTELV
jgi:hypothetical protein